MNGHKSSSDCINSVYRKFSNINNLWTLFVIKIKNKMIITIYLVLSVERKKYHSFRVKTSFFPPKFEDY